MAVQPAVLLLLLATARSEPSYCAQGAGVVEPLPPARFYSPLSLAAQARRWGGTGVSVETATRRCVVAVRQARRMLPSAIR